MEKINPSKLGHK